MCQIHEILERAHKCVAWNLAPTPETHLSHTPLLYMQHANRINQLQAKGFNYGFVEYDDPGAAERAMQTLNGRRVHQAVRTIPRGTSEFE